MLKTTLVLLALAVGAMGQDQATATFGGGDRSGPQHYLETLKVTLNGKPCALIAFDNGAAWIAEYTDDAGVRHAFTSHDLDGQPGETWHPGPVTKELVEELLADAYVSIAPGGTHVAFEFVCLDWTLGGTVPGAIQTDVLVAGTGGTQTDAVFDFFKARADLDDVAPIVTCPGQDLD